DQVEAMTMATRVAVMSMGRLQQVGTPQEVYNQPVNMFVAQFIGTPPMNCLVATIADDGAGVTIAGGRLPLPAGLRTPVEARQSVVVGVRPEHFEIVDSAPLKAEVRAVEWLGHECLITAVIADQPVIIRQSGMAT